MNYETTKNTMETVGIKIDNRTFGEVMDEISSKWSDLSAVDKAIIALLMTGVVDKGNLTIEIDGQSFGVVMDELTAKWDSLLQEMRELIANCMAGTGVTDKDNHVFGFSDVVA